MVRVEEFFLQNFQVLVVQVKLQLEGAVRDPATTLEYLQYLVEHGIEIHCYSSNCMGLGTPEGERCRQTGGVTWSGGSPSQSASAWSTPPSHRAAARQD